MERWTNQRCDAFADRMIIACWCGNVESTLVWCTTPSYVAAVSYWLWWWWCYSANGHSNEWCTIDDWCNSPLECCSIQWNILYYMTERWNGISANRRIPQGYQLIWSNRWLVPSFRSTFQLSVWFTQSVEWSGVNAAAVATFHYQPSPHYRSDPIRIVSVVPLQLLFFTCVPLYTNTHTHTHTMKWQSGSFPFIHCILRVILRFWR